MRQDKAIEERELFFKQWLRSPRSMGSFIPSSRALARAIHPDAFPEEGP